MNVHVHHRQPDQVAARYAMPDSRSRPNSCSTRTRTFRKPSYSHTASPDPKIGQHPAAPGVTALFSLLNGRPARGYATSRDCVANRSCGRRGDRTG
jgi:hypothetical protein